MAAFADTSDLRQHIEQKFGPTRLIRVGENAVWDLPENNTVLRVYRDLKHGREKGRREIAVAHALISQGGPTIRPVSHDLVAVAGYPATLWVREICDHRNPTSADLGRILRAVHNALGNADLEVERINPIHSLEDRLALLPDTDRTCKIMEAVEFARSAWQSFRSLQVEQIIHGDAHRGNLIPARGDWIICDFDRSFTGPIEWDIVSTLVGVKRFGRPKNVRDSFAKAYGATDTIMRHAESLIPVKEASAITWIAIRALEDPHAERELDNRLGEHGPVNWRPL